MMNLQCLQFPNFLILDYCVHRAEYGCSEVVSRMFKCELCDKEVKHTRNIIGAHMKMVHLISWKEYQVCKLINRYLVATALGTRFAGTFL